MPGGRAHGASGGALSQRIPKVSKEEDAAGSAPGDACVNNTIDDRIDIVSHGDKRYCGYCLLDAAAAARDALNECYRATCGLIDQIHAKQ